jgi:hypothetical protein
MNLLTLKFKATECNGWPKLRVLLDLDIIETCEFTSDYAEVTVPVDLQDGEHSLIVELYSKNRLNTLVDSQGTIVKDQSVELIDMLVDGINLPDYYKWRGIYRFSDQEHPQSLLWGCNGSWQWDFKIPLLTWILDVKIEHSEKYNPPLITYADRLVIEQEKIQHFEDQLSKL